MEEGLWFLLWYRNRFFTWQPPKPMQPLKLNLIFKDRRVTFVFLFKPKQPKGKKLKHIWRNLRFLPYKDSVLTLGLWGCLRSQKTKAPKTEPQKTRVKKSLIDSPHPVFIARILLKNLNILKIFQILSNYPVFS